METSAKPIHSLITVEDLQMGAQENKYLGLLKHFTPIDDIIDNAIPSKYKRPQKPYNVNPKYNKRPKCSECRHRGNVSDETHECSIHGEISDARK